jgi:parvulin-like peptidyl-prolyl isomerase
MNLRKLTLIGSLLLVVSQFPVQAASPARLVDRIIAVVNDEAITTTELQHRLTLIERQLRNQGTPLPPQSVLEKQMLERLIIERIQLQQARETALQIDDTQLDTYLRRVADANKLSVAEFRYAIEKDGIPWSTFRNEIRDELTISRLREREVDHRLVITDGEIDNYLATPATNSSGGEDYNIAHILLRVSEQASPEQLLRVRARAEQAQLQLKRGDDFAQVAASFSDAPDAMTGGLIGARPLDRLPGLYGPCARPRAAISSKAGSIRATPCPISSGPMDRAQANELSQPIWAGQSPFGIPPDRRCFERPRCSTAATSRPSASACGARQALRERKLDEAYQDWLRQLRDRAYVEIRLDEN